MGLDTHSSRASLAVPMARHTLALDQRRPGRAARLQARPSERNVRRRRTRRAERRVAGAGPALGVACLALPFRGVVGELTGGAGRDALAGQGDDEAVGASCGDQVGARRGRVEGRERAAGRFGWAGVALLLCVVEKPSCVVGSAGVDGGRVALAGRLIDVDADRVEDRLAGGAGQTHGR